MQLSYMTTNINERRQPSFIPPATNIRVSIETYDIQQGYLSPPPLFPPALADMNIKFTTR